MVEESDEQEGKEVEGEDRKENVGPGEMSLVKLKQLRQAFSKGQRGGVEGPLKLTVTLRFGP